MNAPRLATVRRLFVTVLAVATTAGLAGCIGASPEDDAQRDSITAGTPGIPEQLTPFLNNFTSPVLEFLYSPLVQLDPNNEVVGALAESWEISEDSQTVTFHLRQEQEWSDGTPITSADALWSMTQYLDSRVSPTWASILSGVEGDQAYAAGEADSIAGLSAPDDSTLVVQLSAPNASWVNILAVWGASFPVLPSAQFEGAAVGDLQNHEFFASFPVVSGPYTFESWQPGQSIEFEANENWSGGEASIRHISYVSRDASTAVAQIQTGELDYYFGTLPAADITRLEGVSGIVVARPTSGTAPSLLGFNLDEGQLDNVDLRRGILHAIDREGICSGILEGDCTVPLTNIRQITPEWSIPTDGVTEYNYDPDLARDLIESSGFDTSRELVIIRPLDPEPWQDAVVANLTDVGLNVTVEGIDGAVFTDVMSEQRDTWQMWFSGGGAFIADPHQEANYTRCDRFFPNGSNIAHQCIEAIEPLWEQGIATTDEAARAEIYHEIFRALSNDPAQAYIFVKPRTVFYTETLQGVEVLPFAEHSFWQVGTWSLGE